MNGMLRHDLIKQKTNTKTNTNTGTKTKTRTCHGPTTGPLLVLHFMIVVGRHDVTNQKIRTKTKTRRQRDKEAEDRDKDKDKNKDKDKDKHLSWSHNGTEISFNTTECSESVIIYRSL